MFQKVNMASESIDSYMRSVVVVDADKKTTIEAKAGDFVKPVGLAESSVYSNPDDNVFTAIFANDGDKNVLVLDPVKVAEAKNDDLVYRIGVRTLGLGVNAGDVVAARQIALNDQFLLSKENFVEGATFAKNAEYNLSSGKLTKVENGGQFVIDDVRTITEGVGTARQTEAYLVRVQSL